MSRLNVVPFRRPESENIPAALRSIADDIEAGKLGPFTVAAFLAAEERREGGSWTYSWFREQMGPNQSGFAFKGLLSFILAED